MQITTLTPDRFWPCSRPVVGPDKISPLTPSLEPHLKRLVCDSLLLSFMVVIMLPKMCRPSRYCKRLS